MTRLPSRFSNRPGLRRFFKSESASTDAVEVPVEAASDVQPQPIDVVVDTQPTVDTPDYEAMKYADLLAMISADELKSLEDRKTKTLVEYLIKKWERTHA